MPLNPLAPNAAQKMSSKQFKAQMILPSSTGGDVKVESYRKNEDETITEKSNASANGGKAQSADIAALSGMIILTPMKLTNLVISAFIAAGVAAFVGYLLGKRSCNS